MKKVAFFLDNNGFASIDCSHALNGNPGIGGTEWLFIVVSSLLSNRHNKIDVTLYTTRLGQFPQGLKTKVVKDLSDAIALSDADKQDLLIIKHLASNIVDQVLDVKTQNVRIICWCHVFVCHWELDYYADNDIIEKVVFVGREMYDLYRDHRVFPKSTYIYNCIEYADVRDYVAKFPYENRGNVIVYVGSLVPFKGFHLLARAWPKIVEQIPNAELYVIGSGKLYDENAKLGRWGIAESKYEDSFMPYLIEDGRIHPNVHFLGVLGEGKKDILLRAKIGVPNPSGITETFCLSAVEMQMYGSRIATINYPGYLDTVRNGKLYNNRNDLAKTIVSLFNSSENNYEDSMDYFESEFSYDSVSQRWEALIQTGEIKYDEKIPNLLYRFKWLKEIIRNIKQVVPFLKCMPMLERVLIFIERKLNGRVTYIDS